MLSWELESRPGNWGPSASLHTLVSHYSDVETATIAFAEIRAQLLLSQHRVSQSKENINVVRLLFLRVMERIQEKPASGNNSALHRRQKLSLHHGLQKLSLPHGLQKLSSHHGLQKLNLHRRQKLSLHRR